MITTLKTDITVKDICEGFVYNELEACGYGGAKFIGRPERGENYQYNLIFPPRVTIEIPAEPEELSAKRILP